MTPRELDLLIREIRANAQERIQREKERLRWLRLPVLGKVRATDDLREES